MELEGFAELEERISLIIMVVCHLSSVNPAFMSGSVTAIWF